MIAVLLACTVALGVYLVFSALACGQRMLFSEFHTMPARRIHHAINSRLVRSGITTANRKQFFFLAASLFCLGALVGWTVFGGVVAPMGVGLFASYAPFAMYHQRRQHLRAIAADSWPRMIEELRVACTAVGRPIPQALWEVGKRGPEEYKDAFAMAEREWSISTDFKRCVSVLKRNLHDATADVVCETLLIAHDLGGSDVEKRLAALASDRNLELAGRKDARAKQAGVRFARRFVLIVPIGMAIAGMSIGNGRSAYSSTQGQLGVLIALLLLACCWFWSGRLIVIPGEQRVFGDDSR